MLIFHKNNNILEYFCLSSDDISVENLGAFGCSSSEFLREFVCTLSSVSLKKNNSLLTCSIVVCGNSAL